MVTRVCSPSDSKAAALDLQKLNNMCDTIPLQVHLGHYAQMTIKESSLQNLLVLKLVSITTLLCPYLRIPCLCYFQRLH